MSRDSCGAKKMNPAKTHLQLVIKYTNIYTFKNIWIFAILYTNELAYKTISMETADRWWFNCLDFLLYAGEQDDLPCICIYTCIFVFLQYFILIFLYP